jgi:sulfate adenylyltransferase
MPRVSVTAETVMDAEKIALGAYSPLEGFMVREDYESVLERMRLADGLPWTIPIIFAIAKENVRHLREGDDIILEFSGKPIAMMNLEEIFTFDRKELAVGVYGTADKNHPNVRDTYRLGRTALSGKIDLIQRPHSKFAAYELTPSETRGIFRDMGWKTIAGYQCRNPPHGAHEYIQRCALEIVDGLFIHPVIGKLKKGDYTPDVIINAYRMLLGNYYPKERVLLASLSIAMRYAGPRAAVFLAIVRKNYGCTHFIVGRDIAGVGNYYKPYAAHNIFDELDVGIEPIKFDEVFYCRRCCSFATKKTCGHGATFHINISQTEIREMLKKGKKPPDEIMRHEVAEVICKKGKHR